MRARPIVPRFVPAALLVTLLLPGTARAQAPGDLDPTFGTGGVARVDVGVGGEARHNVATGLALQPDGRILLAGAAIRLADQTGPERMAAVRLTAAGAPDPAFGSGGKVRLDALPGEDAHYWYGRVALGPGGEIYLHNGIAAGPTGWVTARLRPGGGLATGFGDGGFVGHLSDAVSPADVAVQPDGRLLVLSDFNDEGAIPINQEMVVQRYDADGVPDPAFGELGSRVIGFNRGDRWEDYAHAMTVAADGRILVVGQASVATAPEPWNDDFAVARLTAAGELDPTFSGDGRVTIAFDRSQGIADAAYAVAVDGRGRILVGGVAGGEAAIVRLRPGGTLDPTFSGDGKTTFHFASAAAGAYDQVFGLVAQGDGAILAVGRGTNAGGTSRRFGVARLREDGTLDPAWGSDGTRVYDLATGTGQLSVARAVALLDDGSILAAGGAETNPGDMAFVAVRLHNDYLFADGFDRGDTGAWSAAAP